MHEPNGKVLLVATLDSKGDEVTFLKEQLDARGRSVCVMDVGTAGSPEFPGDVTRKSVASRTKTPVDVDGPAEALSAMAVGATAIVNEMFKAGEISAIAGVGGGKGAGVFHQITCDLPYGFPKLLVTSARPALLAEIATTSDTILLPTIVDLMGINRFTNAVLINAANMLCGLEWAEDVSRPGKTVAVTAFGVTTPAVQSVMSRLEGSDVNVIVFPANGAGGRSMESLIAKGEFDGVIDLTTTEMADLLLDATASAGEGRLTAAGAVGIPQAIAPGAVDMANFGPPESIPKHLSDRTTYRHTPMTTLVRTIPDETAKIAYQTADRLNRSVGPVAIFWPARGVSDYDRPGKPFHDPVANVSWRDAMQQTLRADIPVLESDFHINDPEFGALCADWMIAQLSESA
ncbi:MAG: Tm-1-like ATP-binding domain-containing protein [Woeseiaceae bacterium]|nr:Tm-1-like ATP-binding domain-containing protein [Woeseiaceae bacterium]